MNICFFSYFFPKISETFILNQVTGLMDHGHNIKIFALKMTKEMFQHHQIKEYRLENDIYIWNKESQKLFLKLYEKGFFDIIHCHFGNVAVEILPFIPKDRKIPIIVSFYGRDVSMFPKNNKNVYLDLQKIGNAFVTLGNNMKAKLIKIGFPAKKVFIVKIVIDSKVFKPDFEQSKKRTTINILTVARFVEKKGLVDAIRAVTILLKQGYSIEYKIIGDGELKNTLLKLIEKLQAGKSIKLIKPQEQKIIAKYMHNSDIFLLPSCKAMNGDEEGTPAAIAEAMASSLPIVSTFHADIPEMVENRYSGILVKEHDVIGLNKAITKLIDGNQLRIKMGKAGNKLFKKEFYPTMQISQLIKIYRNLCKTRSII